MIEKANLAQAGSGAMADNNLDVNKLKEEHAKALHKIQELSDRLAQSQTKQVTEIPATSAEVQKMKEKAAQAEEQLSQLLLQYNNLKAERDSLQKKLNATMSKNGNSKSAKAGKPVE
jgi:uncharacterized coiled-coil DUF342 family protein